MRPHVTPQCSSIGEASEAKLALVSIHRESTKQMEGVQESVGILVNCVFVLLLVVVLCERNGSECDL